MKKSVKNELMWLFGLTAAALYATKKKKAAIAPALVAAGLLATRTERTSFEGQAVLITGGSRGLGFALARELLKERARVMLLARDDQELQAAKQSLLKLYPKAVVRTMTCDVTDPADIEMAIHRTVRVFDGLDLLINNAGAVTIGPWETMTPEDFQAQLKLHLYAPMNAIRFALPYLRARSSGKRILNICSLGGRLAIPHMLTYDTSKYALSGFSQGAGVELAAEGISVTTVYPALIRTGSPIQAVFKGDHEKEFAWFQTADILPGISIDAQTAARKILNAARDRRWELIPSLPGKLRMVAGAFVPELVAELMAGVNRLLPKGHSFRYQTGAQSREAFEQSKLTKHLVGLAHKPEKELNQTPKADAFFNMGLH
jgi:NAD(P)-dependent dehydrogenase (short-subunit alcohol dehydrogenase family)